MNQLLKNLRILKKKKNKTPALRGNPQKRAECVKVFTKNPKKPNSAIRKVTKIRIEFRLKKITCFDEVKNPKESIYTEAYIPGEGHTLKQQNIVLVRGGRTPDLPGIKYRLIRGKFSFEGLQTRKTSRSLYGTKRGFTTAFDSFQTMEELEDISHAQGLSILTGRRIEAREYVSILKTINSSSGQITEDELILAEAYFYSQLKIGHSANVEAQERLEEKILSSKASKRAIAITAATSCLSKARELKGEALTSQLPEIFQQGFVLQRANAEFRKIHMELLFRELQAFRIFETCELVVIVKLEDFLRSLIVALENTPKKGTTEHFLGFGNIQRGDIHGFLGLGKGTIYDWCQKDSTEDYINFFGKKNIVDNSFFGLEDITREGIVAHIRRIQSHLTRVTNALYPSLSEFEVLNFELQGLSSSLNFPALTLEKNTVVAFQEDLICITNHPRRSHNILALIEEISTLTHVVRGIEIPADHMFVDLHSLYQKLDLLRKEIKPASYLT